MNIHDKIENIITALDTDSYNDKARAIEEILEVIGQWVGDRKSVDELKGIMSPAMKDLADQVCFKEGYNAKVIEMKKSLEKEAKAE